MKRFFLFMAIGLFLGWWFRPIPSKPVSLREKILSRMQARTASAAALPSRRLLSNQWEGLLQSPLKGPQSQADAYFEAHRAEWGLAPHHEFRSVSFENPLGTFVKYQVYQAGILVPGMEIQLRVDRQNEVREVQRYYRPLPAADLDQPRMEVEKVRSLAQDQYETLGGGESSLILFAAPGVFGQAPVPAFVFAVKDKRTSLMGQGVFRASDGALLTLATGRLEH
jgi:hypothetical protein